MPMIRTYLDAGVLIAAARGKAPIAIRALEILDDPNRQFVSSIFLKLELLPKTIYFKNSAETEFYEAVLDSVSYWANSTDSIVEQAYREACAFGLAALDALHVAAAVSAGADELVTTEKSNKPIHRTRSIKVISIWEEPTD